MICGNIPKISVVFLNFFALYPFTLAPAMYGATYFYTVYVFLGVLHAVA
jgi:hypothetical protein